MLTHLADVSMRSLLLACSGRGRDWKLMGDPSALQHAIWTAVVCGMLALFAFGQTLPGFPLRLLNSIGAMHNTADRGCRWVDAARVPFGKSIPAGYFRSGNTSPSHRLEGHCVVCVQRHRFCIPCPVRDGNVSCAKAGRNRPSHFWR